jgi:hypothetical protein
MRELLYDFRDIPFLTAGLAFFGAWILSFWRHDAPPLRPLATAGIVLIVLLGLGYLCLPGFAYSSEIAIATIAWNHQLGLPIYHAMDAPFAYNLHYGPWLFLLEGWSLKILGPSYIAAKLPFVGVALLSLALTASILRPRVGADSTWILTGLAAWLSMRFELLSLVARGDAFIIFGTVLALWGALRPKALAAALWVALALALLNGVKIHAAIFGLPGLVQLLRSHGWKAVFTALLVAAVLMILPFVALGVDAGAYMAQLRLLSHEGLSSQPFKSILVDLAWFCLPVAAWFACRPASAVAEDRWRWLPLLLPTLAIVILGSKPGSGSFHLYALMLPGLVALGLSAGPLDKSPRLLQWALFAFMVSAAATGLAGALLQGRGAYTRVENPSVAELQAIRAALPGESLAMGCRGDSASSFKDYWANVYTWQRMKLTFAGMVQPFEEFSQRDLVYAGRPLPAALVDKILAGSPPLWLMPRFEGKAPFDSTQIYDGGPMFNPLQHDFSQHFHLIWTGACFELWLHNGQTLKPQEMQALQALPQPVEPVYPAGWK